MRNLLLFAALALPLAGQDYDIVLRGGRVMDPETKLDAVRDVGIRGGTVAALSETPLAGKRTIDVRGLVVAPGFIDLHSHGQDLENQRYKAADGVTTALELEIGTADVAGWYREREGRRLIHTGVSAGHVPARIEVMREPNPGVFVPSGDAAHRAATDEEITAMKRRLEQGLAAGALGAGFGLQYTPAASRSEVLEMFRAAGAAHAAAFVHLRYMGAREPANALSALEEVLAAAAVSGAAVHVVHITSSGLRQTPGLLRAIAEARAHGIDITTECYPYTAAQTELQSAMFDEGWQQVLGVDYGALEWAETGERLDAASFARYRRQGGMVIMHMIPEEIARLAVASPLTMIASDGYIARGKGHPRGAGTFARALGYYVREQNALGLMDALGKMTLEPARRLEARASGMRRKGRIQAGSDADITVFDPRTVADRATFRQPTLASAGIRWVLVAGVPVIADGRLDDSVRPGRAIRASH